MTLEIRFTPSPTFDQSDRDRLLQIAFDMATSHAVGSRDIILSGKPQDLAFAVDKMNYSERRTLAVKVAHGYAVDGMKARLMTEFDLSSITAVRGTDWVEFTPRDIIKLEKFFKLLETSTSAPEPEEKVSETPALDQTLSELGKIAKDAGLKALPVLLRGKKELLDEIKHVFLK